MWRLAMVFAMVFAMVLMMASGTVSAMVPAKVFAKAFVMVLAIGAATVSQSGQHKKRGRQLLTLPISVVLHAVIFSSSLNFLPLKQIVRVHSPWLLAPRFLRIRYQAHAGHPA